ncbi:type VII secretion protein EccCa [Streptomyces ipomoeae]|uniref:Type VII secretion protein EccCa n=1 Tax=Streptomyces ipomoeae 91-03 TaxID=698759 RepID=L1KSP2_9ACTN|nr:type VII secretion protein EccCa [Streptomyces ipomoeae]EKX63495.1 type VII secretion protein EccCa [Streptomyces ipomoeae 91-03]MDX2697792.1 type VII secretion protein EccCa [Streptomyces ipomoeae]MDX2825266.1 type VII secretion protein EccCa [Streptomyces ipomoeae]MDX2843783.1 type VII secretion protein EccCa [Streptomyces ipomoeae]MDX2877809.1 type VII secretion protein EccCa [Streptomyces ipomoeae]
MTQQLIHRPARSTRPLGPPQPRTIEPPPNLPEGKAGSAATSLLPMAGVMGSVVMMTVIRNSQFAALGAIVLVCALFGAVALFLSQRGKAQRTRRTQRERYLEYLEELREEFGREERERRQLARVLNPPPEALYDLVRDPARLWERRRRDPDFLRVRVGTGDVPMAELAIGQNQGGVLTPPDPFMLNEARALLARYSVANDCPITVPLDRAGNVSVVGDREGVLRVARALLVQVAVTHAPDDVAVALGVPGERLGDWEWAKWLPHVLDGQEHDGPVAARRIAPSLPQLARHFRHELGRRASYAAEVRRGLADRNALKLASRMLVVSDEYGETATELPRPDTAVGLDDMGVTVLHLLAEQVHEPDQVSVRITVRGDQVVVEDLRDPQAQAQPPAQPAGGALAVPTAHGTPDEVTAAGAEGIARLLAPLRLSAESAAEGTPVTGPVDFPGLLGIDDPAALDLARLWAPRGEREFLRVPIGLTDRHDPVLLDLKESSELGMGPHGLCVGATGSGKSELLRTLVLALAATHSPEELALVLVDYKGGATFAPFTRLPHVAGVITNLENQAGLVERVHSSLAGEVKRRQQVLKDAGNSADIGHYAALRATRRPDLEPLPHLFVVIDEFGELLTAKPDFIDLFLSIGRIGRSIGVHLLLSSQRIEGGKLKGLDTYLSYRLGLRTFSADESRTVLDTTDAFHLPPLPGFGYLKVDTSTYERFKAGYVSGAYRGPALAAQEDDTPLAWPYPTYNTLGVGAPTKDAPEEPKATKRETGPTVMSVMVDQLASAARPVRRIWLPPLPDAITLDAAAGPVRVDERGLRLAHREGPLRVPLGVLDDPAKQWQGRWVLDLTVAGGHVAVIGGPQSGKTTLLRTLALSLATTHTPAEVAIYGLDLVGGGLSALSGLPHVGGIAGRADRERAARTVAEVRTMLIEREELFREHGIDSVDQLRQLRGQGKLRELGSTDIVLLIDGFGALRDEFAELDDTVVDLLKRGGGYGIHVVGGMLRWNDVRIATQSMFGKRIELRLNDPSDSSVDRKLSETLSADTPGRVLTDGKLFAQTALPRIDGRPSTGDLGPALDDAARTIRSTWHGELAAPVRVLPTRMPAAQLPSLVAEPQRVPIGVDQDALAPVLLDLFGSDQHLLILGDNECGKTNLLKLIAARLVERYSDEELVFGVFDPRRGLRGVIPEPYRGGYAHNAKLAAALASGIATELEKRMPETADPDAVTDEPSFEGPRIVILVDDYDILTTAGQQPLAPFLPYVSSAQDIGLHFVITRRVAGSSRAMYEPLLQALRETGTAALLMTGERSEGQLFPGVYASAQPAGRGTLVRRGRAHQLIQTAVAPEGNTQGLSQGPSQGLSQGLSP